MHKKAAFYTKLADKYYNAATKALKDGRDAKSYKMLFALCTARAILGDKPLPQLRNHHQILDDEPFATDYNDLTKQSGFSPEDIADAAILETIFSHFKSAEFSSSPVRFILPRALAFALHNTGLKGTKPSDLHFPYDSFVIELPRNTIIVKRNGILHEASYIIVVRNVPCLLGEVIQGSIYFNNPDGSTNPTDAITETVTLSLRPSLSDESTIALGSQGSAIEMASFVKSDALFRPDTDLEEAFRWSDLVQLLVDGYLQPHYDPSTFDGAHGVSNVNPLDLNKYIKFHAAAILKLDDKKTYQYLNDALPASAIATHNGPTASVFGESVEGPAFREAVFRIIVNTILYISSPSCDKKHVHHDEIESLKKKAKKKKGKAFTATNAQKKLKALGQEPAWLLGTKLTFDPDRTSGNPTQEPGSGSFPSHATIVRGHWRRQAYGPKHGLRRLQWIKPFIRGKHLGPPVAGHNYDVKL